MPEEEIEYEVEPNYYDSGDNFGSEEYGEEPGVYEEWVEEPVEEEGNLPK